MTARLPWRTIEDEVLRIDRQIEELRQWRQELLLRDPDYADYLNTFRPHDRLTKPLTIRAFHEADDKLAAIRAAAPGPGAHNTDAYAAWWDANKDEIIRLENLLCA